MDIPNKKKVMISFREGGENGGPNNSHKRIVESKLNEKYDFIPLYIPKGHLGIFNVKVIKKMAADIKRNNPDIVHFTGLELVGWYGMLACKFAGVKNTLMVIRGSTEEAIAFNKNILKKYIIKFIEYLTLKNTAYVYGVSEYIGTWKKVKKYAKNYCGHIYNLPLNEDKIETYNQSFREELGIDKDDIVIASAGRITKEKGYEILKNVILNGDWDKNIHFVIVGDGNYLDEMKSELNNLRCNVHFTGFRNDVGKILKESDLFVLCTLHETLCNSVIEASQNGLPVVASKVGGIPEIIADGKSGFLVDPGDESGFIEKINILLNDIELRDRIGNEGTSVIERKFNYNSIINSIDDLYREILENK